MSRSLTLPWWAYGLAIAAMSAAYLFFSLHKQTDSRPLGTLADIRHLAERKDLNVVFIVVDTLRSQRLGIYGYARDTSPVIDSMAKTGIRFGNHISQSSWTKCSMASLWTSLYPARNHVLRYDDAVSPEARMPAEILKEAGFRTAAIWRNGWLAPNFGFSQGFDTYQCPGPLPVPPSVRKENPSLENAGSDHELILSVLEFLRTYGDQRFFLYTHLMDVHQYVYDEESALFGTTYSDIYDNAIRRTDHHIGMILAALEEAGLRDKTIVILASDHGEAFGEHGFEGHAKDLYSEVTRTPWIMSLPFRLEPGVAVSAPTENVDVWPTVFDLIGLKSPEGVDGRSRVDDILRAGRGEAVEAEQPRFSELDTHWGQTHMQPRPLVAVTEGTYRLFYYVNEPDHVELYDTSRDPQEHKNIATEDPERVARLVEKAKDYLERGTTTPWEGGAPKVDIDNLQLLQLKALGYKVD